MSDLNELAQKYAAAVERRVADERMIAKVKARFHEQVTAMQEPRSRVWFALAATATVAAAAVAFVLFARNETPLGVAVRNHTGERSDFVLATHEERTLDFTDGSEVVVRKGSQLRLLETTAVGASATLERGSAHVSVVHREKTRWTFTAGPYRVHVIGTRFELAWDPDTTGFEVQMEDGVVEIDGPGMVRQRVAGTGRLELFAEPQPLPETEIEPEPDLPVKAPARHVRSKTPPPPPVLSGGQTWRYLVDTGDAAGAMSAAEQAGFSSLAGSMVQQDVLLLGDTARRARKTERAKEAYTAVRERFPGSPAAIEAALRLGALYSEVKHDDANAAKWFERALRDGPNAPTAVESMGRWLDALSRGNDKNALRLVAQDYLRRFPNGPEAPLARSSLSQ